jgi:hypothetical protein
MLSTYTPGNPEKGNISIFIVQFGEIAQYGKYHLLVN